jgi:predicted Rossmann-fold nucleotide-binding protein
MIIDEHYRVAIFGSARIKEGEKIYQEVFAIARGLAEQGFDIVTGGGPGLMLAANSGHKSADSGLHSLGLNIKLRCLMRIAQCIGVIIRKERLEK